MVMVKSFSKFKTMMLIVLTICLTISSTVLASPNDNNTNNDVKAKQDILQFLVKNCNVKIINASDVPKEAIPKRELTLDELKKLKEVHVERLNAKKEVSCNEEAIYDSQVTNSVAYASPIDTYFSYNHYNSFSYSCASYSVSGNVRSYGTWGLREYTNVTPTNREIISVDPRCELSNLSQTSGYGCYAHNSYPTASISADKKTASINSHIHAHVIYTVAGNLCDECLPVELYGSYSIDVR